MVVAPDEPYDAVRASSIDGMGTEPHDHAILRALQADYDASKDPKVRGSARCTIFVARLDFRTEEETLRKTFERFGPLHRLRLVRDVVTAKSRGYAFVEFEYEDDARAAYRAAHGLDIDGARILVDMERERRMEGWVPRRLGGGFGGKKESGQLRFGGRDKPWRQPARLGERQPQERRTSERGSLPPSPIDSRREGSISFERERRYRREESRPVTSGSGKPREGAEGEQNRRQERRRSREREEGGRERRHHREDRATSSSHKRSRRD